VLRLDPRQARVHNNLGAALSEQGRPAEALASFERALELWPEYAEAHKSRAMVGCSRRLRAGLGGVRVALAVPRLCPRVCRQPSGMAPPWTARRSCSTRNRHRDTFQFLRYTPLVKARGAACWWSASGRCSAAPPLPGVDEWVAAGAALPDFDTHLPLLSLPRVLGTTLATVPAAIPYLAADPDLVESWRRELSPDAGSRSGSSGRGTARMPPTAAVHPAHPLRAAGPGRGGPPLQPAEGRGGGAAGDVTGRFAVTDLGSRLDVQAGAFLDTAAVMRNLDLMVSCDTAAAIWRGRWACRCGCRCPSRRLALAPGPGG